MSRSQLAYLGACGQRGGDVTLNFNYHLGEDRAWPRVLETCKIARDETIFSIFTLSGTLFCGVSLGRRARRSEKCVSASVVTSL